MVLQAMETSKPKKAEFKVPVGISARHIHLSREAVDVLFGEGYQLTNKKDLSQPGQFACEERVTVVGPKKELAGVSILGPARPASQVEISLTDARSIGVNAPIRESGDVAGSGACKLVGPCGEVELSEGVIIAMRHIHMLPEDAERLGLVDNQVVSVEALTDRRTIFPDTVIRVSPNFRTRMHVDVDEAGAAHIAGFALGRIIK